MGIRVDATRSSAVVLCDTCVWRALADSRESALRAGAAHARMHGDDSAARELRQFKRRRRTLPTPGHGTAA